MTDRSSNDEYIRVKNIFRRPKIRDDMMSVVTAFSDYMILGNKRPEEVAMDVYGDPRLDWVILIANNITRLRDEWPLTDVDFQKYAIEKYGSEEKLQEVHHYVTQVMFDDNRRVVIPEGLVVDSNFDSRYLERNKARQEEVTFAGGTNLNPIDSIDNSGTVKDSSGNVVIHNNILPITNYEFEEMEND